MFLHARKGHVEPLGKGCDRSVRTPKLLQNAAAGGVRERAERGIEVGLAILSHMVQYTTWVMECTFVMDALVAYSFDRVDWMLTNPTALTKTATGLEGLPLAYTPTNDILTAMTFGTYPAFAFPRTPADSFTDEYQFSTNFSCRRGRTSSSSVCCTSAIIRTRMTAAVPAPAMTRAPSTSRRMPIAR